MWIVGDSYDRVVSYSTSDGSSVGNCLLPAVDHEGNLDSFGIWADETTIWVSDRVDGKICAYERPDCTGERSYRTRQPERDIVLDSDRPAGIWSDGATMLVIELPDMQIHAYPLPPQPLS